MIEQDKQFDVIGADDRAGSHKRLYYESVSQRTSLVGDPVRSGGRYSEFARVIKK